MPSLETRDLCVSYGSIQALWNVTMNIGDGEAVVSVLGPNGAGKSTLLKSIMGIVACNSGEIVFGGIKLNGLDTSQVIEAGLAYVPEGRHVFPGFTVEENLRMGSFPRRARKHHNEELTKSFELFPLLKQRRKQRAGTLSGGEAQMLAIARGLMSRPKLLLLDEPSAGLSPIAAGKIFSAIRDIRSAEVNVLMVEQDVARTLSLSDKSFILENGRITKSGRGEDLLHDEHVRRAYLGV